MDLVISSLAAYLTTFVKPGTIQAYLSAVRNLHIELGIPDPFLDAPLLQRVMRGMCRVHGTAVEKTRLPITMPVLKGLIHALQSSQAYTAHDKAMLSAAMLLAFFWLSSLRRVHCASIKTSSRRCRAWRCENKLATTFTGLLSQAFKNRPREEGHDSSYWVCNPACLSSDRNDYLFSFGTSPAE